jgi:hypothetical protein
MRNAIKKNKKSLALSAVAAAGLSAWVGAPAAHGAFVVTPVNMGNTVVNGVTYTTYVFTAAGDATSGTLLQSCDIGTDVAQSNAGAIAVDIEHSNSSSGAAAKYTVNLDGTLAPSEVGENTAAPGPTASSDAGQSVFGDPGAGTFGGVGYDVNDGLSAAAPFSTDITDNPFVTEGAGSTAFVYTNNQTTTYGLGSNGGIAATWNNAKLAGTGHLDSAFETSSTAVGTVGGISANAPTLYSLETLFAAFDGTAVNFQPANATDPAPFYQVVIKAGTTFSLSGQIVMNAATENYSTVIGTVTPPSFVLTFGNTTPGNSNAGPSFTMTGLGHGSYNLQTKAVTAGAQSIGYSDTTGFNPATDVEVYGLQIDSNGSPASGSTLATIVASMEASLQSTDTNWNAYTLPSGPATGPGVSAIAILEGAGDNAEVVLPDVTDDAFLSWNLPTGVTITQVSVVPEPTGIAAMVLGGSALLARKRRRKA